MLYQNVGLYLGLFAIGMAYLARANAGLVVKTTCVSLSVLALGLLLVTGARGALLASLLALSVAIFRNTETQIAKPQQLRAIGLRSLIGLTLLLGVAVYGSEAAGIQRLWLLVEGGDQTRRIGLFTSALNLWTRDALTFTVGGGQTSFSVATNASDLLSRPHNIILELLSVYGVVGLLTFCAPFAYILRTRAKYSKLTHFDRREEPAVLMLAILFAVLELFSGNINASWPLIFFLTLLLPSEATLKKNSPDRATTPLASQPNRKI